MLLPARLQLPGNQFTKEFGDRCLMSLGCLFELLELAFGKIDLCANHTFKIYTMVYDMSRRLERATSGISSFPCELYRRQVNGEDGIDAARFYGDVELKQEIMYGLEVFE